MWFVILHYHLFKNAGSTFEDILDHSFGERFGKLETTADAGLISPGEVVEFLDARPTLQAFSSHQIRYPMPLAPGYLFFDICFLRDPLDRLRSFYDYFRQKPNPANPISALANSSGLGDFMAGMIRDQSLFVRNNQVNLMACGGDSDEPNEQDLLLAIQRMRACSFPGVVDCFEQSVAAGTDSLRCAFPELDCARPPINVSRGLEGTVADRIGEIREACTPEVYAKLLQMTDLDRQLVQETRTEVWRRFRKIRSGGAPAAGASGWLKRRKFGRLFDPAFYLRKYPDVAAAQIDPLRHYKKYGFAEDRKPNRFFEPRFYRANCRGQLSPDKNPLEHFLEAGAAAANPHPLFDCQAYLEAHPGVTGNPLLHFLEHGQIIPGIGVDVQDVEITEEPHQLPFLRTVSLEQIRIQMRSR